MHPTICEGHSRLTFWTSPSTWMMIFIDSSWASNPDDWHSTIDSLYLHWPHFNILVVVEAINDLPFKHRGWVLSDCTLHNRSSFVSTPLYSHVRSFDYTHQKQIGYIYDENLAIEPKTRHLEIVYHFICEFMQPNFWKFNKLQLSKFDGG